MALRRQAGAPLRLRLRASFYVSAGLCAILMLLASSWRQSAADLPTGDTSAYSPEGEFAQPRRLISEIYPQDAILRKPYYSDPNRWLVILHCIGIGYTLLGLNTVCDVYFTGALDVSMCVCVWWQLGDPSAERVSQSKYRWRAFNNMVFQRLHFSSVSLAACVEGRQSFSCLQSPAFRCLL